MNSVTITGGFVKTERKQLILEELTNIVVSLKIS